MAEIRYLHFNLTSMNTKPRVLLVAPTALDYENKPIKTRKLYLPGLTMPMLAAVTPDDIDLVMVSETIQDIPYDEHWDFVGITGMGSGLVRAWEIADVFRERGIPVAIGGIAASLCNHEWTYKHADVLVTGEAEQVWPEVIRDFLKGELKPRYVMTHRPDIASLPQPRYDRMHPNELGLWRPVQATRGCPFPCEFCSIQSYFERSYRKRPVDQVVRDVRAAKKTGSRYIAFIDDNIGVDWKYFEELMRALIPEDIIWISQCSIHIAEKPEMLELAYKSGCRLLSFGIESVNQKSVDTVGKTFNHTSQYDELLYNVRQAGIAVSSEMIVGLDEDEEDVFDATYEFLMRNKIPVPRLYILTPVPGTSMYEDFEAEGRIFNYNLGDYNGGKAVYTPGRMSAETLQEGYWDLYNRLFTVKSIYKRIKGIPASTEFKMKTFLLGVNMHYRKHISQRITPGIV